MTCQIYFRNYLSVMPIAINIKKKQPKSKTKVPNQEKMFFSGWLVGVSWFHNSQHVDGRNDARSCHGSCRNVDIQTYRIFGEILRCKVFVFAEIEKRLRRRKSCA